MGNASVVPGGVGGAGVCGGGQGAGVDGVGAGAGLFGAGAEGPQFIQFGDPGSGGSGIGAGCGLSGRWSVGPGFSALASEPKQVTISDAANRKVIDSDKRFLMLLGSFKRSAMSIAS